jgi:hypothetical protein
MMLKLPLTGSILAAALAFAQVADAATFIVNNTQDVPDSNTGDGICHAVGGVQGTCTLRAAIMEANALGGSHTILLPSGTYSLTRQGTGEDAALNGDLDVTANIQMANFTDNPPLVFGANSDRMFDVRPGASLSLFNINIAGGYANAAGNVHGGGVRVGLGASLTLNRVVMSSNIGNIGGAIYNDGAVTITDSEFFNNAVTDTHTLLDFVNGAAILSRGTLSIERSSFHNNGLVPGADGINFITTGFAIHARATGPANPSVTMVNTTVADNVTNGVRSESVPLSIQLSTIANNNQRGLRFTTADGITPNQLVIARTVIVDHGGTSCNGLSPQPWNSIANQFNASDDESCGFSGNTDHQNIAYPFFGPLANHGSRTPVLIPRPESPIVDGGSVICIPSCVDQRGKTRPVDGNLDGSARTDIGAVEFDPDSDPVAPPQGPSIFANGFEAP